MVILFQVQDTTSAGRASAAPARGFLIGLMGMVLAEQDDEWQDGRRYFRPESMARIDVPDDREEVSPALLMASLTVRTRR
jgi:hypothetical protein